MALPMGGGGCLRGAGIWAKAWERRKARLAGRAVHSGEERGAGLPETEHSTGRRGGGGEVTQEEQEPSQGRSLNPTGGHNLIDSEMGRESVGRRAQGKRGFRADS